MNLFMTIEKRKSSPPKKAATAKDTPITIIEYLKVSCLVGQLTFFISVLTSLKKFINFPKIFIFFDYFFI